MDTIATPYELMVTKKSGEKVPFSSEKIFLSLKNVGVTDDVASKIVLAIETEVYDGIPTRDIYKKTFSLLRKYSRGASLKYRLKEAITQLGTTGYPFERFVADLFAEKGYQVKVGVILDGHAITHEIDVLAIKHDRIFTVECKYHTNPASKSDVKVPMYILSRSKDLENQWKKYPEFEGKSYQQWIATNTRFTDDAIKFAEAYNIGLLSWDYPRGQGLKEWIQLYGAFPITCLSCLSKGEKEELVRKGLVSCQTIYKNPRLLNGVAIPEGKKRTLLKELRYLYETVMAEGQLV
ncbi:MAG: restriction endonuclease [Flavobacteriales bacterium]|jgi:hypothetical protein|nr:restriction endonuclease [Flavobacteriales bacterium]MBQ5814676.1 restriction endonuclease [Flavobacteriales bacterium]